MERRMNQTRLLKGFLYIYLLGIAIEDICLLLRWYPTNHMTIREQCHLHAMVKAFNLHRCCPAPPTALPSSIQKQPAQKDLNNPIDQ